MTVPDARLDDPGVVRAVSFLNQLLGGRRQRWSVRQMKTRDLASLMHALHALSVYAERSFQPADAPPAQPDSQAKVARKPSRR